jgi:hypothetical protein
MFWLSLISLLLLLPALAIFALGVWIGRLWLRRQQQASTPVTPQSPVGQDLVLPSPRPVPIPPRPNPEPCPPVPPRPAPCPQPKVADNYTAQELARAVTLHLSGTPADGSRTISSSISGPVVWVDKGDEVLVHLESVQTRLQNDSLLISVDLETDQTGRQPLVMALSLSNGNDGLGLIATTDELPRGNGVLAARWGAPLQSAIWASLLKMSQQHAFERNLAPRGISISGNALSFHADAPLAASTVVSR